MIESPEAKVWNAGTCCNFQRWEVDDVARLGGTQRTTGRHA